MGIALVKERGKDYTYYCPKRNSATDFVYGWYGRWLYELQRTDFVFECKDVKRIEVPVEFMVRKGAVHWLT